MAKKTDLKNHTPEDLKRLVADKREELRSLRFNVAGSKNRDVKAASKFRKEIARALTQSRRLEIGTPTKASGLNAKPAVK